MDRFLEEMLSQPDVLRGVAERYLSDHGLLAPVAEVWERGRHQLVLFTGMGSSYFAAYPACIRLNAHGLPAVMLETSELLHYYAELLSPRVLLVAVSQSGETVEVRRLLEEMRGRTTVVGLTNGEGSYLARNCDVPLSLAAGPELGPASKTYTAATMVLHLLALRLTAGLGGGRIAGLDAALAAMEGFLGHWQEGVGDLAGAVRGATLISLLGRGASLGSAWGGALMLKEAAKANAEAMSAGQFRHGPLEAVAPGVAAILFAMQGRTREINLKLARDVAACGGRAITIGGEEGLREEGILNLPLPPLDELWAPLVEIVPIQLLSWRLAQDKGLASGRFDKACKVTLAE